MHARCSLRENDFRKCGAMMIKTLGYLTCFVCVTFILHIWSWERGFPYSPPSPSKPDERTHKKTKEPIAILAFTLRRCLSMGLRPRQLLQMISVSLLTVVLMMVGWYRITWRRMMVWRVATSTIGQRYKKVMEAVIVQGGSYKGYASFSKHSFPHAKNWSTVAVSHDRV